MNDERSMFVEGGRRRGRDVASTGAFTLLEVLLTLALIGLLVGTFVTVSIHLTEPKPVTAEDVFWKAVTETRRQALLSGKEVRLSFLRKDKSSALVSSSPEGLQRFPFQGEGETVIDFLTTQKSSSAILIAGQLVETQTMPFVTFYGDGTCTPFRVQIRTGGPARTVAIDPWTCAPVLAANGNTR